MPINQSTMARVAPFAFYILTMIVTSFVGDYVDDTRWLYSVRIIGTVCLLMYYWSSYDELSAGDRLTIPITLAAIMTGIVVFIFWINLHQDWMNIGDETVFDPSQANGNLNIAMVIIRIGGAALVVPLMEELFWRSFLMRWIDQASFQTLAPKLVSIRALCFSSLIFALEHTFWLAGLLAGLIYGVLYIRTQNLWYAIIAHGVTNAMLGIWVIYTQQWQYW